MQKDQKVKGQFKFAKVYYSKRNAATLSTVGWVFGAVLDHLHLCRVCLQLAIPPSDVTKHSMQLPSTCEPLQCAAPVPVYACLSLCVDIVF